MTTSDFDRSSRQQQVIAAVWKKMLTLETLARAPQLWVEFDSAFNTDLQIEDAIQLAYFAQGLDPEQIRSHHFDPSLTRDWTTSQGAQVLLPKTDEIRAYILDLVSPPG
jgi:anionic cell wall polymer biosynthesis LytR-Cps2A-Psr (LCP) family protein